MSKQEIPQRFKFSRYLLQMLQQLKEKIELGFYDS